jgi:DNA invertase Pin-like site-specific DNA recombinase
VTEASAPVRACIYARCSLDDGRQDEGRQVADLEREATSRGWTVAEVVRDRSSGALPVRPGLERVFELARTRAVDVVMITETSRLTRRGIRALLEIFERFEASGTRVLSLTEPLGSTDGEQRNLVLAMFAYVAKVERDSLAARTRSKMRQIREHHERTGAWSTRSGRPIGRPRRLTAELEDRVRVLRYDRHLPWAKVAQHVGLPCGTVRKVRPTPRAEPPRVENPP